MLLIYMYIKSVKGLKSILKLNTRLLTMYMYAKLRKLPKLPVYTGAK